MLVDTRGVTDAPTGAELQELAGHLRPLVDGGLSAVAWVAAPGFDGFGRPAAGGTAVRPALAPAPRVDALDPTGCGDVFGAVAMSRLLACDGVEDALAQSCRVTVCAGNADLDVLGRIGALLRY